MTEPRAGKSSRTVQDPPSFPFSCSHATLTPQTWDLQLEMEADKRARKPRRFWCRVGGHFVAEEQLVDHNGRLHCPEHKQQVRLQSRSSKFRVEKVRF